MNARVQDKQNKPIESDQVDVGDFVILRGPFGVDGLFIVGHKDENKTKLWGVSPLYQKTFDPMHHWHVSNVIIDIPTDEINPSTIIDVVKGVSSVENCVLAPSTRLPSSKSIQKLTDQINAVQYIFNLVHHDFHLPEKIFGCLPDDQQKEFMENFLKSDKKYRIAENIYDIKRQIQEGKLSVGNENFVMFVSEKLGLNAHEDSQTIMPQDDEDHDASNRQNDHPEP